MCSPEPYFILSKTFKYYEIKMLTGTISGEGGYLHARELPILSSLNRPAREIWDKVVHFSWYLSVTRGMSVSVGGNMHRMLKGPSTHPFVPYSDIPIVACC